MFKEERLKHMELRILYHTARSAVLELADGGKYHTRIPWQVYLNGMPVCRTDRVITNLFGLSPDTDYTVSVKRIPDAEDRAVDPSDPASGENDLMADESVICRFRTETESVTLNVKDFGAAGDGVQDDTLFLQAAIAACPPKGRVLVPEGIYRFHCLFLKSDLRMCLEKGAVLAAFTQEERLPLLPGLIQTYDEQGEYNLGTWEGNPLECLTGLVSGFGVRDVTIYGEGTIDGCASHENWWRKDRVKVLPARPRLFFLNRCRDVTVQGIRFCNSPSWTIHPYFSDHLAFYGCEVSNPAVSPNTDGLDPESCRDIQIVGMRFSLGDDCIAVKSGKIYMGRTYRTPTRDLTVRQCLLENGHGAVTIGSEMAGGVLDMLVEDCIFRHTDRGLRIKTRRGRGKDAVLDGVTFRRIRMEEVLTPLVINCFYYCDPDGHTSYVRNRECLPVDERTPELGRLIFEDLVCENCHVRAAHIEGLPEKKIRELELRNVSFRLADHPQSGQPAMADGVEECAGKGIYIANVEKLVLEDVTVSGQDGEAIKLEKVSSCLGDGV